MKRKRQGAALLLSMVLTAGSLAGCSSDQTAAKDSANGAKGGAGDGPLEITIGTPQVGEAPKADSEIERAIEQYTNSRLEIQWIPTAAFEDKKNVMIASGDMPKAFKLTFNATTLSAIQSGLFWEIGPYLKDYKNLAEPNPMHYDNIKVDGKLYGLPLYRDIGRAGITHRKDWFDALGLKAPVTIDDWYQMMKTVAEKDPDKNGQADTYGMFLDKSYNDPVASSAFLTRLAVAQGAPNKWGLVDGKVIPEFMTAPYQDSLKLLRRLYAEKLINQDFSVVQAADADNKWNAGKVAIRVNTVASAAATSANNLKKAVPDAVVDVVPFAGPGGNRVPAEPGNNGFFVFPKSSVKSEEELKRLLAFFDKLLEPEMSTLLTRGLEGKHFKKTDDGKAEFLDLNLFNLEVKPFRDSLPSFEVTGKGLPLKLDALQEKGWKVISDNLKNVVPNVALTLNSKTYVENGSELDTHIRDAQTKFIMGKLDEAGFQAEIEAWRKMGGDKVIEEFTAEYAKQKK
ncbi:family 1 extracellular solute-binding protein [Paenibacillus mucilaginosus 3016]|uniref:Family 1 extracellular solute-binding protein n=2 Tax=Paenibacillus mucilaginosus TaxID=61624 RepID=H6NPG4_9BACL|nr:extracellular solute-binding protein [Paenibacillus mucilaginosus]AFC32576.1 family 1 extracellular solute-binding protein [Paenibacillus mucilaginosus 3016]AFH64899.1 ABC transporter substrate-binding protein [Paenibacillus mucilaginosus K02]WFA21053.1 extracellular solute-binding protein [Paenibacillus mucilaginosus]